VNDEINGSSTVPQFLRSRPSPLCSLCFPKSLIDDCQIEMGHRVFEIEHSCPIEVGFRGTKATFLQSAHAQVVQRHSCNVSRVDPVAQPDESLQRGFSLDAIQEMLEKRLCLSPPAVGDEASGLEELAPVVALNAARYQQEERGDKDSGEAVGEGIQNDNSYPGENCHQDNVRDFVSCGPSHGLGAA
jgi:hypothetical protein